MDYLRVGDDIQEDVSIPLNAEVKAPASSHPSLPDVAGFVIFLGSKRRVAEVLEEETCFAVHRPLDLGRSVGVALQEAVSPADPH